MPSFLSTTAGKVMAISSLGVVAILAALAIFFFSMDDSGSGTGGAVATVADRAITPAKVDRGIEQYAAQLAQANQTLPEPGSEENKAIRRQVVSALVQREVFELEAERCGKPCVITDKAIDDELAKIVKENFNDDKGEFDAFLTQAKLTQVEAREEVRSTLLQTALRAHFGGKPSAGVKEARAYYNANREEFNLPEQRQVRHILVATEAAASRLRARIVAGEDFAKIAKASSTDPGSAEMGGDLGAYQPGQFVPAFDEVAADLGDGELSAPVKTQFGWHLIEATITKARTQSFAEVREDLVQRLRDDQINEKLTKWQADVEARYEDKITYADPDDDPENAPPPAPAEEAPAQPAPQQTAP